MLGTRSERGHRAGPKYCRKFMIYTVITGITGLNYLLQNDPSIPTRSNKKTGAKSKKELREKVTLYCWSYGHALY